MWLSLVERCVRDAEVAGSNPVIPTNSKFDDAEVVPIQSGSSRPFSSHNLPVLRTEIVDSPDWAERLRGGWSSLVEQDPLATPFQTWEWQSTWFKYFGRAKKPFVWTVWEGSELVGLMPFVEVRSPWSALRPMGFGPSDYLQPLSRQGFDDQVSDELASFLLEKSRKRLVDIHQLRETLPLAKKLCEKSVGREQAACLVLDLPKTYDQYLALLGKSLRFDCRKLEKEPFKSGTARIVSVGVGEMRSAVDFFFEAHKKRWSKRGLPGAFMGNRIRDFHREWAELAAQKGWLWMSLLELDGQSVGAIYAMRLGPTCYFYQSGFDPSQSSISPGTLLVAHTIQRAIEEGLTHFDFLRGDEPYKRRWQPQSSYRNLRFLLGERPIPKVGKAWNRAAFRLEQKVRARFEGKGLKK